MKNKSKKSKLNSLILQWIREGISEEEIRIFCRVWYAGKEKFQELGEWEVERRINKRFKKVKEYMAKQETKGKEMSEAREISRMSLLVVLESLKDILIQKSIIDEQIGVLSFVYGRFFCKSEMSRACSPVISEMEGFPNFAVNGSDFYRFLQRGKTEMIQIRVKDSKLLVSHKNTKASFACTECFSFKIPDKWDGLIEEFAELFHRVAAYASKSFLNPVLMAVSIQEKIMMAADGFMFYQITGEKSLMKNPVLIPASSSIFLKSLKPNKCKGYKSQIYFKNSDGYIGVCSLLGGEPFHIDHMVEDQWKAEKVKFSKTAIPALDRCSVFVEKLRFDSQKQMTVSLKGNVAIFHVETSEGGIREKVEIKCEGKGKDRKFSIRPDLFKECLQKNREVLLGKKTMQIKGDDFWFVSALIQ